VHRATRTRWRYCETVLQRCHRAALCCGAEAKINRSLLALGNCIQKLASGDERRFVNYRDRCICLPSPRPHPESPHPYYYLGRRQRAGAGWGGSGWGEASAQRCPCALLHTRFRAQQWSSDSSAVDWAGPVPGRRHAVVPRSAMPMVAPDQRGAALTGGAGPRGSHGSVGRTSHVVATRAPNQCTAFRRGWRRRVAPLRRRSMNGALLVRQNVQRTPYLGLQQADPPPSVCARRQLLDRHHRHNLAVRSARSAE
jgi:hypothetical protein